MKVKKSVFNYVLPKQDYYLIYNTLYNTLVRLNVQEYVAYESVDYSCLEFVKAFLDNGLWVDESIDEKARYIACSKAYTLYVPRPLSITITTTLKCNARCVYCYEKGIRQVDIFDGSEDKIIEFIKLHSDCNRVHLLWFGGEPLMNTEFIDLLCTRLRTEGIEYDSYIITNGSLLNREMIEKNFCYWNIKDMQITLDGPKDVYESIKKYKNASEGEFYTILNSIRIAAQNNVFINIRLNIGRGNKGDILELLKELDNVFSRYENVVFYPAFLTGEEYPLSEEEKVEFIKEMLLNIKNINRLTTGTKMYSLPRMHACMNGDPKSYVIDVHGNIFSCEHYVGRPQYKIGKLEDNLRINESRGKELCFREECQECVFLPKCYGGCEANSLEGDAPCMIEKYMIKAYMELL